VRQNNAAKWYSSGHDYFWALSELLESAEETIFILDWCVIARARAECMLPR
jgi:phospholipase D1/2